MPVLLPRRTAVPTAVAAGLLTAALGLTACGEEDPGPGSSGRPGADIAIPGSPGQIEGAPGSAASSDPSTAGAVPGPASGSPRIPIDPVRAARAAAAAAALRWEQANQSPTSDPAPSPAPEDPTGFGPLTDGSGVKATLGPDGRALTLTFTGSPDQPGPCGADYSVESVQRPGVVVVTIAQHERSGDESAMCIAIGAVRAASVTLDAPLGARPLLGPRGLPVARG